MKGNLKRILCILLTVLMITAALAACAKDEETDLEETSDTTGEPNSNNGDTDNAPSEENYKEVFYYRLAGDKYYYSMKLTDTEAHLEWLSYKYGYSEGIVLADCPYYIDSDGNYVVDMISMSSEDKYFGASTGIEVGGELEYQPIVFKKYQGWLYSGGDEMFLIKLGERAEVFVPDLYIEQNSEVPDTLSFCIVDGNTGIVTEAEAEKGTFVYPDTSVLGDTAITVSYENKQYDITCHICSEVEYPEETFAEEYSELYFEDEEPAKYVKQGTSFEEYVGENTMMCYTDRITNDKETVPLSSCTVEYWDTASVKSGERIVYCIRYETDNSIYRYIDTVDVIAPEDMGKGKISDIVESFGHYKDGVYYLEKGTPLPGISAYAEPYDDGERTSVPTTVAGYDPNKTGIQIVTVTSSAAVGEIKLPIYVYDPAFPIVTDISFDDDNFVYDFESGADFDKNTVTYTYCDGSTRKYSMKELSEGITQTFGSYQEPFGEGDIPVVMTHTYLSVKYRTTVNVDGKDYEFTASVYKSENKWGIN